MATLRADVAELTGRATTKRNEIATKRQMFLDWKRAVSDGWRVNKDDIEKEVNKAIDKLRELSNSITKET